MVAGFTDVVGSRDVVLSGMLELVIGFTDVEGFRDEAGLTVTIPVVEGTVAVDIMVAGVVVDCGDVRVCGGEVDACVVVDEVDGFVVDCEGVVDGEGGSDGCKVDVGTGCVDEDGLGLTTVVARVDTCRGSGFGFSVDSEGEGVVEDEGVVVGEVDVVVGEADAVV